MTMIEEQAQPNANPRQFLSESAVSPITPGSPTLGEIAAAAVGFLVNGGVDSVIYYSGTDTPTDVPTYVYHNDITANMTMIEEPTAAANPRQFLPDSTVSPVITGKPTIAEISVAAAGVLINGGVDSVIYYTGTDTVSDVLTYVYYNDIAATMTMIEEPLNIQFLPDSLVIPASPGNPTLGEISAAITGGAFLESVDSMFYYTGTDVRIDPPTYVYYNDINNFVITIENPHIGRNRVFVLDTVTAPATPGSPSIAEITTALIKLSVLLIIPPIVDTIVYYTGTDTGTDPINCISCSSIRNSYIIKRARPHPSPFCKNVK